MAVEFTASADKHGIPHEDAIYALYHAVGHDTISGNIGELTIVFVGHPHAQALENDYLEVIVAKKNGRLVVFHAMPLTDKYRYLLL